VSSPRETWIGQAADELGDHAELHEVVRMELREQGPEVLRPARLDVGAEAQGVLGDAALDDLVEAHEGPAADEEDVGRVDAQVFLLRVLAAALRAARWRSCPR
jgi:hypothetical protein